MVTRASNQLDANARELFGAAMRWMEERWDAPAGLLWDAGDGHLTTPHHSVRGSAWYAFGLLMRNEPGDDERAARVIETVLRWQFDAPDRQFHGTFYRAPEEPYPPVDDTIWRDYDPNWREFIVTTLAPILIEYSSRLPDALIRQIDVAIPRTVDGALARGLSAAYTNIALMYAFMLCFAGQRYGRSAWVQEGERMGHQVYAAFKQHDAFAEFNSPTYYGVDLYALALWRSYPALSPLLAQWGSEMEASLWRDTARFYHAGLKNLAGPYDRSYGMDLRRYCALVGVWLRLVMDKDSAPLPDTDRPFDHDHDIAFAPLLAFLGAHVPADAQDAFSNFAGERQIERVISDSPRRVATAWLGRDRMLGAEATSRTAPASGQLHPATIHWRIAPDTIGWVRMFYLEPVDATATRDRVEIATTSEIAFLLSAPGMQSGDIARNTWALPQLQVHVETDAATLEVVPRGDLFEIRYAVEAGRPVHCTLTCG